MRRLDHKSLAALLLVTTRMIKADRRVDAEEIALLTELEQKYGFDRSLMPEAARLTLAEAVKRLAALDEDVRQQVMDSLGTLAKTDRLLERHEALLLLALHYTLSGETGYEVLSGNTERHSGDLSSYVIYCEAASDAVRHRQIDEHWELMNLLMQQHGLQLMVVERIVTELCCQDQPMVHKLMGYMAPELNDLQLEQVYDRMTRMDTATFVQRVLVRDLQYAALRDARPSLLINLGRGDLLRIELHDEVLTHVRRLIGDYSRLASPSMEALRIIDNTAQQGHFRFYGYYHDFFRLLVESEPQESRIVVWPNKSEFYFPDAQRTLRLNQQEASLYTLVLILTYGELGRRNEEGGMRKEAKGLPLCYTAEQRQIEALYRKIYCRKKFVDTDEVIYPDNLAPIRAKIEKKMREQLVGLDNLEDFIPRNENREGYYRISAPASMVKVRPDAARQTEMGIGLFEW